MRTKSTSGTRSRRRKIDLTPGRVVIHGAPDAPILTSDDVRAALDDYLLRVAGVVTGHTTAEIMRLTRGDDR